MSRCREDDWRPYVVSELDQMIAGIGDGKSQDLQDARDWLADLILDGDPDVIVTLLSGWRHEME